QENRDVPTVEVLDKAFVPDKQASPNKKLMVLLAFVLSFILTLMYYTYKEFRIYSKEAENEPNQ
ncbi:MAG TPA: hypothetical protein PLV01_05080, partial [Candidatus Kapabacteria bacterium]|nr:hypothetical protein [Candidatus Kapabacteria bacterium]